MTELSPAAKAVLYAAYDGANQVLLEIVGNDDPVPSCAAAALRAAADQFFTDWDGMCCEEHLKSIANELEAQ